MASNIEILQYTDNIAQIVGDVISGAVLPLNDQLAWVTDTDKLYRLQSGQVGDNAIHWSDLQIDIGNFLEYNPLNQYFIGNAIRIGTTFYITTVDALVGESPLTNPEKYAIIQTVQEFLTQPFTGVDVVVVAHTLNLTSVEVLIDIAGTLTTTSAHVEITDAVTVTVNFGQNETGEIRLK